MIETDGLELFGESKYPDHIKGWQMFQKSIDFKNAINFYDCVAANENFFIGKQWEGIEAAGLPTPTFNIVKRVASFIVATINSDNVKVNATPLTNYGGNKQLEEYCDLINKEIDFIFEYNRMPRLIREYTRNAAVDGDGCMYVYWDNEIETEQENKGAIAVEVIENKRVHFGNPNNRDVQRQPWIIIERREQTRIVKRRAKKNGVSTWGDISSDEDYSKSDSAKRTDGMTTVLLMLWKDEDTGEVWAYEYTQQSTVKEPWSLGIRLYPLIWLNWDYVQDCYHGQAMITGLIPNQLFVNKAWAMTMLSIMKASFPKYIYNKSLIPRWDNRVGGAIGIPSGDVDNVAKIIDPAVISPQVSQLIQLAVEQTEESLGATSVALGDTRPDNTSAIIALQRAAATPSEMTKQNLYASIEDLSRIIVEFIGEYYGTRTIMAPPTKEMIEAASFANIAIPDMVPMEFDYSELKNHRFLMKIDVGASTYYSEIAAVQILSNLLQTGNIDMVQFLDRVGDDYMPKRKALLEEKKREQQAAIAAQQATMAIQQQHEVPTGGGYGSMQRQINRTGSTDGIV